MRERLHDYNDNAQLVAALRRGEEEAYIHLLEKYHKKLHAYALGLSHDADIAKDIVQNVLLHTWQFRERLNGKFSIQGFLYKSVYNEFVNNYQKKKALSLFRQKYVDSLTKVAHETESKDFQKAMALVMGEIDNLPAKCREVFLLSKKEGLTNVEIAEYLNISIKTVESQITKAFTSLRKKLAHQIAAYLFLLFGIRKKSAEASC